MGYVVGVDIGGTFTDVSVMDRESGRDAIAKTPTTPADLLDGLMEGLRRAADGLGIELRTLLERTERFSHATTQTTNVMFTWRGGATVGLLTTRGFADEILIMRARGRVAGLGLGERRHLRATSKPFQIVPRERIAEVSERVDRLGVVLEELDIEAARRSVRRLLDARVASFAVSLLWSHQNPAHERALRDLIRAEAPQAHISLSSDLAPVTGEYERASTTVVNAFVAPTLEDYLARLQDRLRAEGLGVPILVFQAGGGVSDIPSTLPVATIESGPAAGMVAVQKLATLAGQPNVIATDVGGTTFKVGLLVGGNWSRAAETIINQYTLLSPMIDVVSVGAGGGSIAWVDAGRLRIGPESAGAAPGPACYGWGGGRPTVTDADVLLGYLSAERPLSGQIDLRPDLAAEAMKLHVADELFGGDVVAAAAGVRQVVDSQMGDLIRKATLERGFDPREFVLVAYGGAGPVHACSYARSAGVGTVVVPLSATAFSAFGAVLSDLTHSAQRSVSADASTDDAALVALYDRIAADAQDVLIQQGADPSDIALTFWADMRYERQLHDVRVVLPGNERPGGSIHRRLSIAFEERYAVVFGSAATLASTATRVLRAGVDAVVASGVRPAVYAAGEGGIVDGQAKREVFWPEAGDVRATALLDGTGLGVGDRFHGPALVELPGTTVAVPPGATAEVDTLRNLVITLHQQGA